MLGWSTLPRALYYLSHWILPVTLWGRSYYYSHFIDKDTEARADYKTNPRLHSKRWGQCSSTEMPDPKACIWPTTPHTTSSLGSTRKPACSWLTDQICKDGFVSGGPLKEWVIQGKPCTSDLERQRLRQLLCILSKDNKTGIWTQSFTLQWFIRATRFKFTFPPPFLSKREMQPESANFWQSPPKIRVP